MAINYSIYVLVLIFTFGGLARSNGEDVLSAFGVEGDMNLVQLLPDGGIQIAMTNTTKSSLTSKSSYLHGVFTAKLRLPQGFSAGIVSSFYMTSTFGVQTLNQSKHQDEADFEFLGNTESKGIVIATNYYADGVGTDTHEEGFRSWFDPAAAYHNYTFQWGWDDLTFLVDGIPIRTVQRVGSVTNSTYLQKPMQIQLSIWDASDWATTNPQGGAIPANYTLQPFSFETASIDVSNSCPHDGTNPPPPCAQTPLTTQPSPYDTPLTLAQRKSMAFIRQNFLTYSNVIRCGARYNNSCTSSPPPSQPPPPPYSSPPPPASPPASPPHALPPHPSSILGGGGGGSGLSSTYLGPPGAPPPSNVASTLSMSAGGATRGSRGGWCSVAMMVMTIGGVLISQK